LIDTIDFSQFKRHQYVRQIIATTTPGMAALAKIDDKREEFHITDRLKHIPTFTTADGLAHFAVGRPLASSSQRSYTLMSVRSEGQFNSIIYEQHDSYRGPKHRWTVLLNSLDIEALELGTQDTVDIISDTGSMRAVSVFPFNLPRGNAMAYYPEANVLIGLNRDPRSQTPAFKSVPVSITKTLNEVAE
jgi:anaerobic selenocysteine-containing dehydrogenase